MSPQFSPFGLRAYSEDGRNVDVHVRHRLPGRMRVQVNFGTDDQRSNRYSQLLGMDAASAIAADLERMDGVRSVRWGNRTGNFLIQHDPRLEPDHIIAQLKAAVLRHTKPANGASGNGRHVIDGSNDPYSRHRQRQEAAWAGWCFLLGVGVGLARLVGFRFAAAQWLPLASWLLTIMQGYGISPEQEASAVGDEAIPALTTGLHAMQGNAIQLTSIYTSRMYRYAANRHVRAMPLGRRHRGYPPLPGRLGETVARRERTGWQGAALTWLLTGNPWIALATLLAGNPRPARVGGIVVQAHALKAVDEAGMRLNDWPDWERLTSLDGVIVDAALLPAWQQTLADAGKDADHASAVDPEWTALLAALRDCGVDHVVIAGLTDANPSKLSLEQMAHATGADLITFAPALDVYERLVQKHAVALVTMEEGDAEVRPGEEAGEGDASQSVAWRFVGADGAVIHLGDSGSHGLIRLLRLAHRVETASGRVANVSTLANLALMSLASTGRIGPGIAAAAVECAALLAAFVGTTVDPPPAHRKRVQYIGGDAMRWEELRAHLPEELHAYDGLTSFEANLRRAEVGPNQMLEVRPLTPLEAVGRQFRGPFVLILALGAGVSALVGQRSDAIAMGFLLGVNALLGAAQELRAGQPAYAAKPQERPRVAVRRDGEWTTVPDTMLVPGDLIELKGGDVVPADALVLVDRGALLDESNLTGESEGVAKRPLASLGEIDGSVLPTAWTQSSELNLSGRHAQSMIWAGTYLIRGRMVALVVATGKHTRASRLASVMNRQIRPAGPLQRELGRWFRKTMLLSAAVGLGVALLGTLRGHPRGLMISTGISMALAAIPEGLPAILTLSFAACAGRLRPGRVAVKRLGALEALGCVSVLCLDKTGTLTQNNMRVERLLLPGGREVEAETLTPRSLASRMGWARELRWAILVGAGCNDVQKDADGEWTGDPMELALVRLAEQVGFDHESWHAKYPRVTERPFDAVAGYMAVLCGDDNDAWVLVKGAPERVIPQCTSILIGGKRRDLTESERQTLLDKGMAEADFGRRLLSLAYRPAQSDDTPDGLASGLIYAGTVSFSDPLRPETAEALRSFQDAGVRTVMITGDHVRTAEAIARQLNIGGDAPRVMTGPEVAALSRRELAACVADVDVFARVTPHEKMRIVEALQRNGEVVAVTGDGVNDTPALRQADVGIALADGTPAAIEAADVLLMEDTLAGIVRCVQEGTRLRKRLRSATGFLVSGNMGEILFMAGAMALGMPPPLLPSQILLMNVFTDALPALGLALSRDDAGETAAKSSSRQADPAESSAQPSLLTLERSGMFADEEMRRRIMRNGMRTAIAGLAAFSFVLPRGNISQARTAGFISAAVTQLLQVNKHRQETAAKNALQRGEKSWLPSSMLGAWGMLLAGLTVPFIRQWFHLTSITEGYGTAGLIPPLLIQIASEVPAINRQTNTGRNASCSVSEDS